MALRDIGRVTEIAASMWCQSSYKHVAPDVPTFQSFLRGCIASSRTKVLVAVVDGMVEGFIICCLQQWHISKSDFATERMFVVTKEGKGMGARLLFRCLAWVKGFSTVDTIILSTTSGLPGQVDADKIYSKLGDRVGSTYYIKTRG